MGLPKGAGATAVRWSPRDENLCAGGSDDGRVAVWDRRVPTRPVVWFSAGNEGGDKTDKRNRGHIGREILGGKGAAVDWVGRRSSWVDVERRRAELLYNRKRQTASGLGGVDRERLHGRCLALISRNVAKAKQKKYPAKARGTGQQVINPVLVPATQSDPQLIFVTSGTDIHGIRADSGLIEQRIQSPADEVITAMLARTDEPGLLCGTLDGHIRALDGSNITPQADVEEAKRKRLNRIYQSFLQNPITLP